MASPGDNVCCCSAKMDLCIRQRGNRTTLLEVDGSRSPSHVSTLSFSSRRLRTANLECFGSIVMSDSSCGCVCMCCAVRNGLPALRGRLGGRDGGFAQDAHGPPVGARAEALERRARARPLDRHRLVLDAVRAAPGAQAAHTQRRRPRARRRPHRQVRLVH